MRQPPAAQDRAALRISAGYAQSSITVLFYHISRDLARAKQCQFTVISLPIFSDRPVLTEPGRTCTLARTLPPSNAPPLNAPP